MDPQNFGACLRSCFFLGVSGIVTCSRNSAPLSAVVSKVLGESNEADSPQRLACPFSSLFPFPAPLSVSSSSSSLYEYKAEEGDEWRRRVRAVWKCWTCIPARVCRGSSRSALRAAGRYNGAFTVWRSGLAYSRRVVHTLCMLLSGSGRCDGFERHRLQRCGDRRSDDPSRR